MTTRGPAGYTIYGSELIESLVQAADAEDRKTIVDWSRALAVGPEMVYRNTLGHGGRRAKSYLAPLCNGRYLIVYTYSIGPVRLIRIIEAQRLA